MGHIKRNLERAAKLLDEVGLVDAGVVAVSVYGYGGDRGLEIQLDGRAFCRAVAHLRIARSSVKASLLKKDGRVTSQSFVFTARGARWSCCILADSPEWQALEHQFRAERVAQNRPRIEARRPRLTGSTIVGSEVR